jgi:hypothetical protein
MAARRWTARGDGQPTVACSRRAPSVARQAALSALPSMLVVCEAGQVPGHQPGQRLLASGRLPRCAPVCSHRTRLCGFGCSKWGLVRRASACSKKLACRGPGCSSSELKLLYANAFMKM